ncbi:bifunctional 4-hydroxy-2-oxoglutarate aldolase/2-dehydro-3-deoxy-phosphogluconate aldolase [Radiobacillus sp. PE A8.2]|uniref:bifunctional 4-hydroxy-2-oxoglutarate aldolase/2-dehydro-3-deoxy-phosphogluconate aldolase n=1 Tax=Radiobacillus sp. PE A8.2 TaxID=3380349 RepID=UPI00388F503E
MIVKESFLTRLVENGVVAVIRKVKEDKVLETAQSLINGGVTALEVTVDEPAGYQIIKKLSERFSDQAVIGAGTVLDSEAAKKAIENGAEFIVSPVLKKDVIQTTLRYGKISIPGTMTPTEALNAIEYGADIVKIFPASAVGATFIKNIKGPLPQIPIIPTGGINIDNAADYVKAGAIAIGVGGNLVNNEQINNGEFQEIEKRAKQYSDIVKKARAE